MLGSSCCCGKPCGATTVSGGAGVTINTYIMPEAAGQVVFSYQAYTVPDHFIVYNTQNPSEIYFDTGGLVSGGKTIYFYKPRGVKSVTVRVEGPTGTAWVYSIGCPSVSCLQKKCDNQTDGYPETITVTITVPSFKLTIPRLGKEYWYQRWRYFNTLQRAWVTQVLPWALPLDVRVPKPMQFRYQQFFTGNVKTATSSVYYPWRDWTEEWTEDTYVRPDQLPEDPEEGYDGGNAAVYYGKWEYIGKYEFSAEYELDGSLWSGTYELQKVKGTEDSWVYYFPDGPPSCNEFYLTEGQKQGLPIDNDYSYGSYIMLRGCKLSLGNLKAKVHYGLGEATGTCDLADTIKDWTEDFNMNGFSPISWDGGVGWYVSVFGSVAADYDVDCGEPPSDPLYLIPDSCSTSDQEFRYNTASPPTIRTYNKRPQFVIIQSFPMECPGLTTQTILGGSGGRVGVHIPSVQNVTGGGAGGGVGFRQSAIADWIFQATGKGLYQFVDPEWLTRIGHIDSVFFDNGPAMPWMPEYITFSVYHGDFAPGGIRLPGEETTYPFDPYYEESGISWYGDDGTLKARCQVNTNGSTSLHPDANPSCKWCWSSWYKDNGYWKEEWEGDLAVQIDSISLNYIED